MSILFTLRFLQESVERKYLKEIFLFLVFEMSDWNLNRALTSNKSTHYLLGYGDYITISLYKIKIPFFAVN